MSKKMLINATLSGEERVAIVEDGLLTELDIEVAGSENTKGNIYKAEVVRVEPGLQAAFVNYGAQRHGFLQIGDIHPDLWPKRDSDKDGNNSRRPPINEILRRGQQILVQVVKEERGTKGAAVTTELSLAGRYMVLMANSRSRGISRKIDKDSTRKKIKEALKELNLPDEMGYIIRTAALDQSSEELKRDFNYLFNIYKNIISQAEKASAPALIYQESSLVLRSVRDYFTQDMDEVLIDDKEIFRQTREFFKTVMPDHVKLVKLHQERRPIFARYQIEEQIAQLAGNSINLPSGGSIVLDQTEALVAIDVNSGKVSSEQDIESTACLVNVEAATEIARQLRLRDLGGLIVIDFIDMRQRKNARKVEKTLEQALKQDKARITQGRISSQFGLLEMSRQRIKPNLGASSYKSCPHCSGTGRIRSCESRAIGLLRRIQAGTAKGKINRVVSNVALDVATMLLNQKRAELRELEQQQQIEIWIKPRPDFLPDQVDIDFIKDTDSADDTIEEPKALVDIDYGERNQDFEPSPETPPAPESSARRAEHDTSSDKKDEEDTPKPRSQRRSRSSSRRQRSSRNGTNNGQKSKESATSEDNNKESNSKERSSAASQNLSEHSNAAQEKTSAAAAEHKEQASSGSTADTDNSSSAQTQSAESKNAANNAADKTPQAKSKRASTRRKPDGTQQKRAPSSDTDAKESASESAQTTADAIQDGEKSKPRRTPRRSSARKNTAQKSTAAPETTETSASSGTESEQAAQQDGTPKGTDAATARKRAPRKRPSKKTDSAAVSTKPESADTSPVEKTSSADAAPEPVGASQNTQPPGKTQESQDSGAEQGEEKTPPPRKRSPRKRSTSTQNKDTATSAANTSGGTEQQNISQEATTADSSPSPDTGNDAGTASPRRRKSATKTQAAAKGAASAKADTRAEVDSDAQSGAQEETPKSPPRRRTATPRRKSGTAAESSTAKTAAPDENLDAGTAADRAAPDGESESGSKTRSAAKRTTRRTGTRRSSKKAADSTDDTAASEAAPTESAKAETPPAGDNPAPKRRRRTAVRKSAVTPKNDDTE